MIFAARLLVFFSVFLGSAFGPGASAQTSEPPTVKPFASKSAPREDAVPGYVEMSDGVIHVGLIYLTRDKQLQIYDEALQRQREIPLSAVAQIDCTVKRERLEKEWRFKETTSNEKVYTGRSYPAREYLHTLTLRNGKTISGPLSALVYLQPMADSPGKFLGPAEARRLVLHKRDKGEIGQSLEELVFVKQIKLGKQALEEGLARLREKAQAEKQPKQKEGNTDSG